MLQLNPPLWLETEKGTGLAHFVTWDSIEHSLYWTVFLENGQIWTLPNEQVRAPKNITAERPNPERLSNSHLGADCTCAECTMTNWRT